MSAAKDEAENGPDLSSDDEAEEEKNLHDDEFNLSEEDEALPSKPKRLNGVKDEDARSRNTRTPRESTKERVNLKGEQIHLEGTSGSEKKRPSSADGSFSIPDDTPSLQVSKSLQFQQARY